MKPSLPYTPGSATSKLAAEFVADGADDFAKRIWMFFVSRGPQGATGDEVEDAFGTQTSSPTARTHELKYSGLIVPHPKGERRLTRNACLAEVFVVNPGLDFDTHFRRPQRRRSQERADARRAGTRHEAVRHGSASCSSRRRMVCLRQRHTTMVESFHADHSVRYACTTN